MKTAFVACMLLGFAAQAFAEEAFEDMPLVDQSSARFLSFNSTSSAASLTLLGSLILLGVIAYLIWVGGVFGSTNSYNRNDYYGYDGYQGQYDGQYAQYRSAQDGFDFNGMNVIQWISMLQELYDKFDYNDIDCQKRLICEVMKEPEYYGTVARKFKSGFQYAKYLELLSLPDEMRELLDEYLDANSRSEQQKDCNEFFQCDYSIKDSMRKSVSGNDL